MGAGGAMRMRASSGNRVSKDELKKTYLELTVIMDAFKA